MEDLFYPSSDGMHTVHATLWRPQGRPRAILQIIHGMEEYGARYAPFAESAAALGFLVCAEDHLGHGGTAAQSERGHFPKDGEEFILKDIRSLTLRAAESVPDVPVFVLGHSMGSFFCREYIARFGGDLSGAVIMGTGYKSPALLAFARALAATVGRLRGYDKKSNFIASLAFGAYNKRIPHARTAYDWLSADEGNVDAYMADELCGFGFTCGGYMGLFGIMKKACSESAFAQVPAYLPLLIVSGEDDPVGDYGKGVEKVYNKYKKAGLADVQLKLYAGARHEILNDTCRQAACRDVLAFLADKAGISAEDTI